MKSDLHKYILLLVVVVCYQIAYAQQDSAKLKSQSTFYVGAGLQYGFIFAHSVAVQNTKGANPTGVEFIIGKQKNDAGVWKLCNCYPRSGVVLSYYDYDRKILGKSIMAAYFLEPNYRLTKNIFFSFKGASGLSYHNNPFDSITNPGNQSYSTRFNAYLLLGAGLWFRVNDQWWINTTANYQHISNGGLKEPNKGINWPTAGIAVAYQKNTRPYYSGETRNEKYWKNYSPRFDAGIFGIARRSLDENGKSRRLPLLGLVAEASKQVGRINALTLGAEIYRDEELRVDLLKDSIKASAVKAGILAGNEFLLGKILFSQRIGFYIFDQTPYYDQLYHRWGIRYRINKHFGVGINLQVHRQVADFADIRLIYSWQKKDH